MVQSSTLSRGDRKPISRRVFVCVWLLWQSWFWQSLWHWFNSPNHRDGCAFFNKKIWPLHLPNRPNRFKKLGLVNESRCKQTRPVAQRVGGGRAGPGGGGRLGVPDAQLLSAGPQGAVSTHDSGAPDPEICPGPPNPHRLKDRLRLVLKLRTFAEQSLKLPVDAHYRKYADVHRPYVVWNVEAAPEFSMQPKTWWYPLVGSLEYRGYFAERAARNYGRWLERRGYDVYIGGAQAYSTLGWFKDPVLNTFIFQPEADLAEVIFHELGHQRVFARGDTDFNEAFATTVGQEGARRWLRAQVQTAAYEQYEAELRRNNQFVRLIMDTRAQLVALYGDERNEWGKVKATRKKRGVPRAELRREKQRLFERLRQAYAQLKTQWAGGAEYDAWFARELNNAKLNSVATYYDLVPGFQQLLALNGGGLEKFYQAAERLSKMAKKQRHQRLRTLAQSRGDNARGCGPAPLNQLAPTPHPKPSPDPMGRGLAREARPITKVGDRVPSCGSAWRTGAQAGVTWPWPANLTCAGPPATYVRFRCHQASPSSNLCAAQRL